MSVKDDFYEKARGLKAVPEQDRYIKFVRDISDSTAFAELAKADALGASHVAVMGMETLSGNGLWQAMMAFVQGNAAKAMAASTKPEYSLLHVLEKAVPRMSGADRADFEMFFWGMTESGRTLIANYPAAQLKLRLACQEASAAANPKPVAAKAAAASKKKPAGKRPKVC